MLNVHNVTVIRGESCILLQNVTFCLNSATITVIKGRNGIGKSSLLRILAGLGVPFSGHCVFNNVSSLENSSFYAEQIEYLGHILPLDCDQTVDSFLTWVQSLYPHKKMTLNALKQILDLSNLGMIPIHYLSQGQKKRLVFARFLLSSKPIWIFDEPTSALDDQSCLLFENIIDEKRKSGGIVICATHLPFSNISADYEIQIKDKAVHFKN